MKLTKDTLIEGKVYKEGSSFTILKEDEFDDTKDFLMGSTIVSFKKLPNGGFRLGLSGDHYYDVYDGAKYY